MKPIVIATRRSALAKVQAALVAQRVWECVECPCQLLEVASTGDQRLDWSLQKEGGKGLFTAELEETLLAGTADLAVHSAKDLPGQPTPGLVTAGYLRRGDAADVLVRRQGVEPVRVVATGSPRRRGQLAARWPGLEFVELRGNVETRLHKIAEGAADGTVLAAAGLDRLGIFAWPGLEFDRLSLAEFVPAVAQGAIAVQCRAGRELPWRVMLDRATADAVGLERALQRHAGAGCQAAFAAHATPTCLHLWHPEVGYRSFGLNPFDFTFPEAAAERYLAVFFGALRAQPPGGSGMPIWR